MAPKTEFNLALSFSTLAETLGDREVVVYGSRRLTYAQLEERARRLASYLHGRGLGLRQERGAAGLAGHESGQDHVGLALYNGNEYLEGMLGGYRARVAPFNVNYRYTGEELRYLLTDAGARGLVYHASLAPVVDEVRRDVPGLDVLLQVGDTSGNALLEGAVDYEEALAGADPAGPPTEPGPDDLYILYTGGTTGMPKGVLWRQADIFVAAMGGRTVGTWEEVTDYADLADKARNGLGLKLMLIPPLMHGAAQWSTFMLLAGGATVVLPDDPRHMDPDNVWRLVAREKVNVMTIVGDAVLRPLIEQLDRGEYDTSTLLGLGNGGAPLTPSARAAAQARLPQVVITDSAGASETGAQMHAVATADAAPARFTPGPGTVVVSEDLTEILGPGHEGLGWLAQGGHVPLGYLGDAEKTARTFPVVAGARYAIPGDRARLLADGQIELLGRDSVTINSGGEKIFAEEVERAVAGHPSVADVTVAGRPSERWGAEVVAVVQLAEDWDGPTGDALADDIVAHAGQHVARFKLPKQVIFVDQVVRSPSGKADYRWAAAMAEKG